MTDAERFIAEITEAWRRLEYAENLADWEAATTGSAEAVERLKQARINRRRYFGNSRRLAQAQELNANAVGYDPEIARCLKLVYFQCVRDRAEPGQSTRLAELESQLTSTLVNFRAEYQGQPVSDNVIDNVLSQSRSTVDVRQAWEAGRAIGALLSETIREAARVRNDIARSAGYRDHFQKALAIEEIDETELLALFARLEVATEAPFAAAKAEIDDFRTEWFGLAEADLRPWHYGDRFFQSAPQFSAVDMDKLFVEQDPVALAQITFDGLGLNTRDILVRSDLYARPGKDQHAFCIHLDRDGDIRTLTNLQANLYWTSTLLHELGHAVYEKYLDSSQYWLLRRPPHMLSTEAIALLMGAVVYDEAWLSDVLGLPPADAAGFAVHARQQQRFNQLVFTRWVLVMTHFERALYADPDADLDALWWSLVEKYQRLSQPQGRRAPDWASKYHMALAPVYYYSYELGDLAAAQLLRRLQTEAGGLAGRRAAGQFLVERWFRPGAQSDWAGHIRSATGEALNPEHFVAALGGGGA